ncbi:MAG: hypothetical protein ACPK85_01475 [Methanosarcina sp.]
MLGDYTLHDSSKVWGNAAITAYHKHKANVIIGETNNGGEMVEHTLKTIDTKVPFKVVHASRGKATRAEPVSALYEQGKVHHFGNFPELEDQLCEWVPGAEKSPDRLDALVWAISSLSEKTRMGKIDLSKLIRPVSGNMGRRSSITWG